MRIRTLPSLVIFLSVASTSAASHRPSREFMDEMRLEDKRERFQVGRDKFLTHQQHQHDIAERDKQRKDQDFQARTLRLQADEQKKHDEMMLRMKDMDLRAQREARAHEREMEALKLKQLQAQAALSAPRKASAAEADEMPRGRAAVGSKKPISSSPAKASGRRQVFDDSQSDDDLDPDNFFYEDMKALRSIGRDEEIDRAKPKSAKGGQKKTQSAPSKTNPEEGLMTSLLMEDMGLVAASLQRKPKINFDWRDEDGVSFLEMACLISDDPNIATLLLEAGVKPNVIISDREEEGTTVLMGVVEAKKEHMVEVLLQNGADPDWEDSEEETALMKAVRGGKVSIVSKLLEYGADPAKRNSSKKTALQIAKEKNFQKTIELLRQYGAQ